MNLTISNPANRTRLALATTLAALLCASFASGQTTSESLRRLEEENAALRKRLAELEGQTPTPAPAPGATVTTAPAPMASTTTASVTPAGGADVTVLSPFEVNTDKDYGYLKTNATTATRIGMEIQKVPMAVSVLSSDFLNDTNSRSFIDLLKYTASASGDPRFVSARPSNESTPQGGFTLRGFPINIILRNGTLLYSTKFNNDNIDRVEIVKGPAAVFFGQGYPGGVVNYVTKRPQFTKIPTTVRYTFGDNNVNRMNLDHNEALSDKAAFRVVAGWENSKGERAYEFTKRFSLTPSLTVVPFKDPSLLRLTAEAIYVKERYNQNNYSWLYPSGWFQSYATPEASMMTAAGLSPSDPTSPDKYRARIFASLGTWMADRRKALGDPTLPLYTDIPRGGYYNNAAGQRVRDESFNFNNAGSYIDNEQTTTDFTAESSPFPWLDIRYTYTKDNTTFNDIEAINYPNADGITYNALFTGNGSGYYRKTTNHEADLIVKLPTFLGVKTKLLGGYIEQKYLQQYWAPAVNTTPLYFQVPGFNYPAVNVGPGSLPNNGLNTGWNVPVNQVLRDRNGNIMTAQQVYSMWDPGTQIQPPADKVFPVNRNLLDAYPVQYNDWYVNLQGSALQDRLTVLAGFRREARRDSGQALTANYPWFSPPPYAFADQATYPSDVYNYSPSYAATNFLYQTGDSWMGGASFEVTKDVNVYASVSQTFRFNSNTPLGGFLYKLEAGDPNFSGMVNTLLTKSGGSFAYRFKDGTTRQITSVDQALQAVLDAGANTRAKNEEGINYEIGVKTSLWDNRFVSTFSLFRLERTNQLTEDPQHQVDDVFNYNPLISAGTRYFRWRSNDATNRIEGAEAEFTWTPRRNFQSVTNFSWLWTAKTLADPSYTKTNINYDIYFGNRIENVPEYRFNTWNKYTFNEGAVNGLSLALGASYASSENISRSIDWNPNRGGFQAGDYIIYDFVAAYPIRVFGYQVGTQVGVYNLTDEKYFDGGYVPGPRRNILFSATLSF